MGGIAGRRLIRGWLCVWLVSRVAGFAWPRVWLASRVGGFMCGWLRVWLASRVAGFAWLHVWVASRGSSAWPTMRWLVGDTLVVWTGWMP
jgi:hypothetical protein